MKKLLIATLFVVILTLASCQKNIEPPSASGLISVQNESHFKDLIARNENNQMTLERFGLNVDSALDFAESNTTEHSSTNIQVPGVDEGDIIKTDGHRIYMIDYHQLRVIEVNNGAMDVVLTQKSPFENSGYDVLYLSDDYLIVIGNYYTYEDYDYDELDLPEDVVRIPWFGYFFQTHTFIEIYDLDTLELSDSITISGQLNTTRLIANDLYLISTQYLNTPEGIDSRPTFSHNDAYFKPEYQEIGYLPETNYDVITNITHIKLSETITMDYTLYLGSVHWPTVYVSHDSIVLANNDWSFSIRHNMSQDGQLLRFSIEQDGSVLFHAKATYQGHILNQFSIDEYDESIRLLTTEGWGDDVVNRLYIFDASKDALVLPTLSVLEEGIGKPRETIRSVRFNDTFVTVVTYELIDPFYVIDLSNKTQPVILGELEVTGFSTYQHPWKNNTVIGIGYEADGITTLGIKLSLYDIFDPTLPTEIGRSLVLLNDTNSWQYSEALHNHKAFFVSEPHNLIGFSINQSSWHDYTYKNMSQYLIFTVDETRTQPIEIAKAISHNDFENHDDNDYYWYSYRFNVQRALTIGDYLYVISQAALTSHDINSNFDTVNTLIHQN